MRKESESVRSRGLNRRIRTYLFFVVAIVLVLGFLYWGITPSVRQAGKVTGSAHDDKVNLNALLSLPYLGNVKVAENEIDGVLVHNRQRTCAGYRIYSIYQLCIAYLIDVEGNVINSWRYQAGKTWSNCELLANGDLLVVGSEPYILPDGSSSPDLNSHYILRFNWKGQLLWKRNYQAHHDIEVTPGGKLLALTFQQKLVPHIHPEIELRAEKMVMLEQDGTMIESHSLLNGIESNPGVFPLVSVEPKVKPGRKFIDLLHSNSIEWMRHKHLVGRHPIYDQENILVCFRHQDRIAVFNWERNEVIWSWGNGEISGPHDAQVLENGNLLLFDNGVSRKYSRGIELNPVTEEIVWEYKADPPTDFFTLGRGSIQRLPNSNTLMAEADKGRAIEVTPQGDIVWEFINPEKVTEKRRATIVRMKHYPSEFVEAIINKHKSL